MAFEKKIPPDLVEGKTKKVKFIPNVNDRNRGKSIKGVPFVLPYHPKVKSLNKILSKNLYLLYIYTKTHDFIWQYQKTKPLLRDS